LNVDSDKPKGVFPLEKAMNSLSYFIPSWQYALKILIGEQVEKKFIQPNVFT
jgi:hypothetical protein